jgi:hypothetical protein
MIYLCLYLYIVGIASTALLYKALDETKGYEIKKPYWVIVPILWPVAFPYSFIKVSFDKF